MSVSDFSSLLPRCCFELRFLRSAAPHARILFVFLVGSCALDARRAQASGSVAVRPLLRFREEATRSPRFLGCLMCVRATLSDPGGTSGPMIIGSSGAADALRTASASNVKRLSGLHHAAAALAVYASRPPSRAESRARLASGW